MKRNNAEAHIYKYNTKQNSKVVAELDRNDAQVLDTEQRWQSSESSIHLG